MSLECEFNTKGVGSMESDKKSFILSKQLTSKTTLYFATGSTLIFILYSIFVLNPVGSCFKIEGSPSLGLTFSYTSEMVNSFFELRSQDQLDCYRQFLQLWDVLFAVIYTLMYCFWIMYFLENRRILLIVPILAMIADWSENYAELLMINDYLNSDSISETLVSMGSGINTFKMILLSLTYLIIFVGMILKFKSFRRK